MWVDPSSLRNVINDCGVIKDTVEQAASELTYVNEVFNKGMQVEVSGETLKKAITQNSNIELKVAGVADDLDQVNAQLEKEVGDRAELESDLANTKKDLDKARNALTILQAKEKQARQESLLDPLTALPNRALFDQSLEHAIKQAKRHGWKLAVMFIDIDKFKTINDIYGHDTGDKVLQMVAGRLKMTFRAEDTVSRWGGDEFICLLLEVKHRDDVIRIAEWMSSHLAAPFICDGIEFSIKASIGITIYPEDGTTAETLFKIADKAMYKAKTRHIE